jgi:hypothetical protein
MEKHFLALLLGSTSRFYDLERGLKMAGLASFSAEDFEDSQNQELARVLMKGMKQDLLDPVDYLKENSGDELVERLAELTSEIRFEQKLDEVLLSDLYRTLISLRLTRINQVINQLRYLQEDENAENDDKTLQSMIIANMVERGRLDQALSKVPMKR